LGTSVALLGCNCLARRGNSLSRHVSKSLNVFALQTAFPRVATPQNIAEIGEKHFAFVAEDFPKAKPKGENRRASRGFAGEETENSSAWEESPGDVAEYDLRKRVSYYFASESGFRLRP